ncbi:hypothetical protein ABPG74_021792 [Tetrahymena malaccensis]
MSQETSKTISDYKLFDERMKKSVQHAKEANSKQNNLNFFTLITVSFLQSASVSVIIPFFLPLSRKQNASLILKGLVIGINPIGSFVYTLISGQLLRILGQKKLFYLAVIAQSMSISSFGVLFNFSGSAAFFSICFSSRFIQGICRSAINSSLIAYIPQIWPEQIQNKVSLMERVGVFGTLIGPIIGQVIYKYIGNQIPIYVLSLILLCSLFTIIYLPSRSEIKSNSSINTTQYYRYLSDRAVSITFLIVVGISTAQSFIIPLYTSHIENLGLDGNLIGKLFLTLGILIAIFGIEFQGPETYIELLLGTNLKQWYIVTIGQLIINISFSMCILPMVPELNQLIIEKEMRQRKISDSDTNLIKTCSGMASRIFVFGSLLGQFSGPLSAGILYSLFDGRYISKYMNTSRCIAGFLLVILVLYLIVGKSYKGFIQQKNLIYSFMNKSQKIDENCLNNTNKSFIKKISLEEENPYLKNSLLVQCEQSKTRISNEKKSILDNQNFENSSSIQNQYPDDISDVLLSDDDQSDCISFGEDYFDG